MTFKQFQNSSLIGKHYQCIVCMLLLSLASDLIAEQQTTPDQPIDFLIKPKLCIVENKKTHCTEKVRLNWASKENQSLCLFIQAINTPLSCWTQQKDGSFKYTANSEHNITFQLRDQLSDELLISTILEVVKEQTRYRRRRRNPWAFF